MCLGSTMRYFSIVFLAGLAMPALDVGVLRLLDALQPPHKTTIFLTCMALVSIAPGWLFGAKLRLPQRLDARWLPLILPPFGFVLLAWGFMMLHFGNVYILQIVFLVLLAAVPYGLFLLGFLAGMYRREAACLRWRGFCNLTAATAVACLVCLVPFYPLLHNTFFIRDESVGKDVHIWDYFPSNENNKLTRPDKAASLRIASNHPRLRGVDYLLPLFGAVAQAIYTFDSGEYHLDVVDVFTRIPDRGVHLFDEADIWFGPSLSETHLEGFRAEGFTPVQTPIAQNALVFFVHRDNPVQGLTVEDIRRIYAGEVENWSEVGGNDADILAFQRGDTEVQTVMQENVMQGQPMQTPPQEEYALREIEITRGTADYRNRNDAIGYDFYWNALQRFPNGEIRLLAVDGILPTQENISNGSYPFSLPIVMLTCRPLSPESKALHDWILSPEGQALITKTGYAPLPTTEGS